MNDLVKLDVGGTKFKTTRGTLTSSSPDSLLAKMFDPDSDIPPAVVNEDGFYFLDACPRAFSVILNWLRYKDVILGKEVDARDVIPVADYFGLPELCEKLEAMKKPDFARNINNADIIRLNVGRTIFETSRATLTQKPDSILARMFTPGSETSPPLTKDGAYFIDGSPKAAEVIINWLRNGRPDDILVLSKYEHDSITGDNLHNTAKKFGLDWNWMDKPNGISNCRFKYL